MLHLCYASTAHHDSVGEESWISSALWLHCPKRACWAALIATSSEVYETSGLRTLRCLVRKALDLDLAIYTPPRDNRAPTLSWMGYARLCSWQASAQHAQHVLTEGVGRGVGWGVAVEQSAQEQQAGIKPHQMVICRHHDFEHARAAKADQQSS